MVGLLELDSINSPNIIGQHENLDSNTRGAEGALHVKCHTLTSFWNSSGDLPYILLET
jgi:hypothetical protein